ncbi:MAG: CoA ester lyase [Pseudomonadota bacterium]
MKRQTLSLMRSLLFVPGNRPERVDKAVGTSADMVIIDLEDAVPRSQKDLARVMVRDKLREHQDARIMVRINGLDTPWARPDAVETAGPGLWGIMLPKVETTAHIREVNSLLLEAERAAGLEEGALAVIPLIESALGVANAYAIAAEKTEPERVFTLSLGAADLSLDLGLELTRSGEELAYPRARLAFACRAAGLAPPLDTPFMIDLSDLEALEAEARRAKQLGYQGKLCVHPRQVEVLNQVFSPRAEEIEQARKIVQAFEEAEKHGLGAIQVEGKFIDLPVIERARRILRSADPGRKNP